MKKSTIVLKTMREFKDGKLRSSSGDKVTDRKQAIAIALSKSGQSKYENGGIVGQEIVFDDNGEQNTGVIKEITDMGDYVVSSDDGRTVLAQKALDVISLGRMREMPKSKMRFGLFEDGGTTSSKYKIVEGFDHYKQVPLYRVTDSDEYVGEWHTDQSDAEKELTQLTSTKRYIVKPRVKFGMIFGYVVYDTIEKKNLAYEFNEDEEFEAEKRAELSNALYEYRSKSKFKDGGNVRGMDWYQMWQPKKNKVVKVGDIVIHQHSKQPYRVIELLDNQYTVAKLDGDKEVEWKTFYEDLSDHKMFMPQQFGAGGTTLSQYIWNNDDLMIKGRYKVTGAVDAEVVVAGWEVGGFTGKDEYLSMYQPYLEQNPEINTLNVKRAYLRKMSNGLVVPATTGTGKKVKIQRIGGVYFKNDGQPY